MATLLSISSLYIFPISSGLKLSHPSLHPFSSTRQLERQREKHNTHVSFVRVRWKMGMQAFPLALCLRAKKGISTAALAILIPYNSLILSLF